MLCVALLITEQVGWTAECGGAAMHISINGSAFAVTLEENATAREFAAMLPLTLHMDDLHSNEKYHNLKVLLPSAPKPVESVHAGDIMLFGDNCIVIFYKSFSTPYRYTRIGRMDNADELERVCGSGSITVSFSR